MPLLRMTTMPRLRVTTGRVLVHMLCSLGLALLLSSCTGAASAPPITTDAAKASDNAPSRAKAKTPWEQIPEKVRANWSFTSPHPLWLKCLLVVAVDKSGKVQQITMVQRSGNEQFDASARNAIIRTDREGGFAPPPSGQDCQIDFFFTMDADTKRPF